MKKKYLHATYIIHDEKNLKFEINLNETYIVNHYVYILCIFVFL